MRAVIDLVVGHWRAVLRVVAALFLLVIVLQNVEPTSVDLWFWSVERVPKLVLMLISMAVGAALWEIARRAVATRRSRPGEGAR